MWTYCTRLNVGDRIDIDGSWHIAGRYNVLQCARTLYRPFRRRQETSFHPINAKLPFIWAPRLQLIKEAHENYFMTIIGIEYNLKCVLKLFSIAV